MKKIIVVVALMLFAASYAAAYCQKCLSSENWLMQDPPAGTGRVWI